MGLSLTNLIILALLFFATSAIGVVTGSNSLITVPAMFEFGIDEKRAVATNMFGLVFMAIGGTIPFLRQGSIDKKRVAPLVVLTIISSAIGAALVGLITNQGIKIMVSAAMIAIAVFTLVKRDSRAVEGHAISGRALMLTYLLTFLLGIYGGLYSGGYVTVLTTVLVAFFGMSFTESVAATKLINVFSSLIATIVFAWQGLIDYGLGIILAVTMFAGGYVGAHYTTRLNEKWIKRIFLSTVFLLALKMLWDLVK